MARGKKKKSAIKLSRNIHVAMRLEDYDTHLTKGWARQASKAAEVHPALDEATFDFVSEMRANAHTARLPYEMLYALKHFYAGMVRKNHERPPIEKYVRAMIRGAADKIQSLTAEQLTELQSVFLNISLGLNSLDDRAIESFPLEKFWRMMLDDTQYQLSLWGSQRLSYVAIYNSYEGYLTRCIGIAHGQPSYRLKRNKGPEDLEKYFGKEIRQTCWDSEKLEIPRLVRHSLSHAAGKETDELRARHPLDIVINGEVQPLSSHVQELIITVEGCCLRLIDAISTKCCS